MLLSRAQVKPGERVLITGATGGVGSAAIQIARFAGAHVIAAVSTEKKKAVARAWGADDVINYADQGLAESALALTRGQGVEVILDIVGASLWPEYMKAARPVGRIVTCSLTDGRKPDLDIANLLMKQLTIYGTGGNGSKIIAARVVELLNAGRLKPHVDRVFPLTDAARAQQTLIDRQVVGKIILKPWN